MKTEFKVLKAHHGDAIVVKTFDSDGNPYNILIDGGPSKTFDDILKKEIKLLKVIHLLVLTHIDSDHIGGVIKLLKSNIFTQNLILRYWFNSKNLPIVSDSDNISIGQALTLEEFLLKNENIHSKWKEDVIIGNSLPMPNGLSVTILSPSKNILDKLFEKWPEIVYELVEEQADTPIATIINQIEQKSLKELALEKFITQKTIEQDLFNSSSIALILECPDIKLLLLADARAEIVLNSLLDLGYSVNNKLKVDCVKISHHGSKNNTSNELLDIIETENYFISSNGGDSHRFPDREIIARIVHHPQRVLENYAKPITINLNYPLEKIVSKGGKFLCEEDFKTGNWILKENVNVFP